ncbi:MAG: DegT/DnrJ/EryC1/StrS family aminotransferase [Acidiferrobacterales bacterium]
MEVPLLDLKAQYRQIETEISEALRELCASQQFILGPHVSKLEAHIAEYSQCQYGVGVSSGTDALMVALMALGVGPGDEVITTPYSFFASAGVVARLGARPLFCDIDPQTYNISATELQRVIENQCKLKNGELVNATTGGVVKVLLPVHLYGQMAHMEPLMEIARDAGLTVVEDAAQAIGAEYPGARRAGSIGDIGCFSFFPSKNLGAFGDAGMCVSNDDELAERMRILRVHGAEPKYFHATIGGNFRLDALQAAVLVTKLKYLDEWTEQRQKNARYYDKAFAEANLDNNVSTPKALDGYRHIYNQYILRVKKRDALRKYLADAKIGTEIYYPVPLHMQKCFEYLGLRADDYPESCLAAKETIAVPIYPELSAEQKQYVVDTIQTFYV